MRLRVLRPPSLAGVRAPRQLRRPAPAADATTEAEPDPAPEAVFDRLTGPYGARRDEDA